MAKQQLIIETKFVADAEASGKLIAGVRKQVEDLDKAYAGVSGEKLTTLFNKLGQEVTNSEVELNKLIATNKKALQAMENFGHTGSENYKKLSDQIVIAEVNLKRLGATSKSGLFDGIEKSGKSLADKMATFSLAADGIDRVVGAMGQFTEPFIELDKNVRNIGTLGVKNFQDFAAEATKLSTTIPESAQGIAAGVYDAISAGTIPVKNGMADVAEGMKFVEIAAKMATAGLTTTASSVNGLTSVLNAYGLSVDNAGIVSDKMFQVVNIGKLTVEELNSSLSQVLPNASAFGVSFDAIGAAIATMTKQGVPASQSANQLNQALVELAKPGADLKPIMEKAGISLDSLKRDGLQETLKKLGVAMQEAGVGATQVFGSVEAASAVMLLSGKNAKMAADDFKSIQNSVGATDAAFKVAADGVGVKSQLMMNKIQAGFNGMMQVVGTSGQMVLASVTKIAPLITSLSGLGNIFAAGNIKKVGDFASSLLTKLVPGLITTDGAQKKLNLSVLANPYVLAVAGIAALVVGLHFLSEAMNVTAQERMDDVKGDIQANEGKKRLVETQKAHAENNLKLISTYKELASKTNRTSAEQDTLNRTTSTLNAEYPKTHLSLSGTATDFNILAGMAKTTKDEVAGYVLQLRQLGKEALRLEKKKANIGVQVDIEKMKDEITEAVSNIFNKAVDWVGVGSSSASMFTDKFTETFRNAIYKSGNSSEVESAVTNFQKKLWENTDIPNTVKDQIEKSVKKVAESRLKYLAGADVKAGDQAKLTAEQIKAQAEAAAAAALLLKNSGSAAAASVQSLQDIMDQIRQVMQKTDDLKSKITLGGLEDSTKKQVAELEIQNQNELKSIRDQQEKWKNEKNISSSQKTEIIAALGDQEKVQIELNNQENGALLDKIAQDNLKKSQERLKTEAEGEIKIKEAQLQTLSANDEATIRQRYDIQREIALKENEQRISDLLMQNEEYAKKATEIEKLQLTNAPVAETQAAYSQLADLKTKILTTDTLINAELLLQAAALKDITLSEGDALEEFRINQIGDLLEREKAMAILSAEKTYQETVKLAGGSYSRELSAFMDLQQAKYAASVDYMTKTSSAAQQMMGIVNDAFMSDFVNGITMPDNQDQIDGLRDELDGMDQLFTDLKDKYNQGEIDRKEYYDQLDKLEADRKDKVQQLADAEVSVWETAATAMSKTFGKIADSYKQNLSDIAKAQSETLGLRIQNEKDTADTSEEYSRNILTSQFEAAKENAAKLALLNSEKDALEKKSADLTKQTWIDVGASVTGTFLQIAFEEKKFLKASVMATLEGLKALIPIFIAKIFGANAWSIPTAIYAGSATVGLYGLLALAEAGASQLNFLQGGLNESGFGGLSGLQLGGKKQININENGRSEFIVNADATAKGRNLEILTQANAQRVSIEDILLGDPQFMRRMTGSIPTLSATDPYNEKSYKELEKMNTKIDRLGHRPVNVKVGVNLDSRAMAKATYELQMQEARR